MGTPGCSKTYWMQHNGIYDNIVVGLGRTDLKRVEMEPLVRQICLSGQVLSAKPEDTTL